MVIKSLWKEHATVRLVKQPKQLYFAENLKDYEGSGNSMHKYDMALSFAIQ